MDLTESSGSSMRPLLDVEQVSIHFGGIRALHEASFRVYLGQICSLIGPNGAGKTTLFNCITRLYDPQSGDIRVDGQSVLPLRPYDVIGLGVARTFQNLALIPSLTVADNILLGGHTIGTSAYAAPMFRTRRARASEEERRQVVEGLLDDLELTEYVDSHPGDLPIGTLKRIEMARALVSGPRLLLLDEPARGLTSSEVDELAAVIQRVRDDRHVTVLLVEHHMGMVMGMSDEVVVLDYGEVIAKGEPEHVRNDPAVLSAYLGSST